jgi:DNA segregation ATPase FtsK/SpoIIIE, S-DNA-T family
MRAAAWLARHPGLTTTPLALSAGVAQLGPTTAGTLAAGTTVAGLGWYRAHPASYDRYAAPLLRSLRRRWLEYVGRRWADILTSCDLVMVNRRTEHVRVPRILRIRCASPSIDTIYVRLARGQKPGNFTDKAEELAAAFRAERVAVVKIRPQVVALIVERTNPFDPYPIPAVEIPYEIGDVDTDAVEIGDTEYGEPFTIRIRGQHLLCVGATGSGKGSVLWSLLRSVGPLIRAGLVRIWMIDLKGGLETEAGAPLFYTRATTFDDAVELVTAFRNNMRTKQDRLRASGKRKLTVSRDMPLDLLVIDEMAMLTALGDASRVRAAIKLLAEVMTQGRATGDSVAGFLQEPTKDVVPIRDLFTTRVCLAVTTIGHVDMVLGDGARLRGAIADEIPLDDEHAGIGFVVQQRTRNPVRIRAAFTTDADIAELVDHCTPTPDHDDQQHDQPSALTAVTGPDDFNPDEFTEVA